MIIEDLHISGEQLQRLRVLKGMKQRTVARFMDISQQAYSKIEKVRRIDGERLNCLLSALEYSEQELERALYILPDSTFC